METGLAISLPRIVTVRPWTQWGMPSGYPSKYELDTPERIPEGVDRAAIHILPKRMSDDLKRRQPTLRPSLTGPAVCSRALRRDPIFFASFFLWKRRRTTESLHVHVSVPFNQSVVLTCPGAGDKEVYGVAG